MKIISIKFIPSEIISDKGMNDLKLLDCFFCNKASEFVKMNYAHHVNGNRLDNRRRNFLTLCPSCHGKVHSISALLEDDSFEFGIITKKELEQLTNSKCNKCEYLPGDGEYRNHIHHINSNHLDNRRSNLEALCVSCYGKMRRGLKRIERNWKPAKQILWDRAMKESTEEYVVRKALEA